MDQRHGRVETLDLLRLLAALAVVTYHYTFRGAAADGMTWVSLPALVPVTKYGYLGVQLFFVISGFVIAYSAEGRTARQFVIARAARIYPGFLACMSLTFVATLAIGGPRFEASLTQWFANLFIVAPALKQPFMDGVYWSIVYELIFYFWIFVLIVSGQFARRLLPIVAGWLILSLVNMTVIHSGALGRLFLTDASGFFGAGLALYALFTGRRGRFTWVLLIAATALGVAQALAGAEWDRAHFGIEFSNVVIAALSVGAVLIVGLGLLPKKLPLPPALVMTLGGLTYPLYLLHQHMGFMIFNRLQGVLPAPVLIPMAAILMLALAFLVFRFVERPGQRAMKALLKRLLQVPAWLPRRAPAGPAQDPAPAVDMVRSFGPVSLPRAAR